MIASAFCRSLAAATLLLCAAPAFADFVVNTDVDEDVDHDGTCSLREAIIAVNQQANYHDCVSDKTGESSISVAIPPNQGETHVIALAAGLPEITHFVSIDASSQKGTVCTPVPNLRVQVTNPANLGIGGLMFQGGSDFSALKGLALSGFSAAQQAAIRIASDDVQVGCTIAGTDASGTRAEPNYYGIYVNGQSAQIGVATADAWLPNLFSGNSMVDVYIGPAGSDSMVSGNYIGVDAGGVTPLPSAFGVYVDAATGVRIGYVSASAPADRQRNIIGVVSPTATTSLDVGFDNAVDSAIAGNYVGVGRDGFSVVAMGAGIGVSVLDGTSILVGCDGNTPDSACRNVIANPTGTSVENFEGSMDTAIVGNYIGIATDGKTVLEGSTTTIGIVLAGANALVARNAISTAGQGTGIVLSPDASNRTPVFANNATAGSTGATLDSSGNCLQHNGAGVDTDLASNPTLMSAEFLDNWWGAADGPAPHGSGDSVALNIVYSPFLTTAPAYCGGGGTAATADGDIFASGFE